MALPAQSVGPMAELPGRCHARAAMQGGTAPAFPELRPPSQQPSQELTQTPYTVFHPVAPGAHGTQAQAVAIAPARREDIARREADAMFERLVEQGARIETLGSSSQRTKPPAGRLTFVSGGKLASTARDMRAKFSSNVRCIRRRCAS